MNIKRLSIGTIVGAILLYVLGYVIWVWLFADFFAAHKGSAMGVDREMPIQWAMILGALLYGLMITLALEMRTGPVSLVDGVKVGVVVGLLLWGTADFTIYALTNISTLTSAFADTLLEGVHGGITGGIVALILGKVGR
jgi:hypothetical protein